MTRQFEITTGSRLHFGLVSHAPADGAGFGGAGLMIDSPGFQVVAEKNERDVVEGDEPFRTRAEEFVNRYRQYGTSNSPPPCRIRICRTISPHCGLGSGTQLGMAVARALSLLAGDDHRDAESLGLRIGRGRRSAIGIHGFARGGFLVDGGKAAAGQIGSLTARVDFPAEWRLLLVTPTDEIGLSGRAETDAFARLPSMSESTTNRLRGIVLTRLLPAVVEADFDVCGKALFDFGRAVGKYFAVIQGGTYASPLMRGLVEQLHQQGLQGVGQTSWGATIFVLTRDSNSAEELAADLSTDPRWNHCRFHIAAPMNTGAVVTMT
jgi:beta-RFAP synthase